MVIDTSAIIAILFEESDASVYASAITNDPVRLMSSASLVEASLIAMRLREGNSNYALDTLLTRLRVKIQAVDGDQALLARDAFRRFGKGRHRAGLNFGDCFSYALAKQTGEPLLFKGNDFRLTDVAVA